MADEVPEAGAVSRPMDEQVFDLDALSPPPPSRFRVRVRGVEYAIRQMAQLTGDEELDLTSLERAIREAVTDDQVRRAMFDRAHHLVRILIPSMPDHVRRGLQYIEMMALSNHAWAYARQVPGPLGGTGDASSATPAALASPSLAGSSKLGSADSSANIPDA